MSTRVEPAAHQLVAEAGKVVGEDALPLLQQHVDVPRLRHALARLGAAGKAVALDERHLREVVREDAGPRAVR